MLPATRSGRSAKNSVIGLTPFRLSVFVALSKASPFAGGAARRGAAVAVEPAPQSGAHDGGL
jgi:hypothetical protein